jgi:hypothetical protein
MTSPDDSAPPDAAEMEAFERIAVAAAKYLPGLLSIQDDVKAVRFLLSRRAPAPDVERLRQAAEEGLKMILLLDALVRRLIKETRGFEVKTAANTVQPVIDKLRSALAVPAPDGKEKL